VNVSVEPGDTALFVSWEDGTDSTVAAVSYNVTAAGSTGTRTQNFTSVSGLHRVTGLTNGTSYSVTVTSVSAGGNESLASVAATGTPAPVIGFWEEYTKSAGHEQGGCGGGPAGLVSLLGVALALRGLRRRS
jgi:NCAIR mutase (PurE)-related protein